MAKNTNDSFIAQPIQVRSVSRKVFVVFNTAALIIFAASSILPIIHIIALSFSSNISIMKGQVGLWPVDFTTFAYSFILERGDFIKAFLVSVRRVLLGVPLNMLCIVFVAYPLSRSEHHFPARKYYVWFLIVTMLFSGGLVPTYMIVRQTQIYDTIWAMILPGILPIYSVLLLLNFFRNLPEEIYESALMDGAGHTTILFRIYIPLSMAAIATLILFAFVGHWNSWFDGLIYINKPELTPLQTYLRHILINPTTLSQLTPEERSKFADFNIRSMMAASIFITTVPIMVIYPFLQRYFTKGIVLGSVKG